MAVANDGGGTTASVATAAHAAISVAVCAATPMHTSVVMYTPTDGGAAGDGASGLRRERRVVETAVKTEAGAAFHTVRWLGWRRGGGAAPMQLCNVSITAPSVILLATKNAFI